MVKVSVIVPVYNTEKCLKNCLDSLVTQSLCEIEIIVVNDGSPDNSQSIIDEYVKRYPGKVFSVIQENRGLSGARNSGIEIATGEFVAFVDSDDSVDIETYKETYNYAKENGYDIVSFGYKEISSNGVKDSKCFFRQFDTVSRFIVEQNTACNKLIKRDLFLDNGIRFREGIYYEDLELMPRFALLTKKIGRIEKCFYNYIFRENSIMRQHKFNPKFKDIYLVTEVLREAFEETAFKTEAEYLFIEHLLHGAVLNFLNYEEGTAEIVRISDTMKKHFPHWRKNKYYNLMNWKYKVICYLAYKKQVWLLRKILGVKND